MAPDLERHNRIFGDEKFLGDSGEDFLEKDLREQVLALAWSSACPIPERVIREYGQTFEGNEEARERAGLTAARSRYGECAFVFGLVASRAGEINPFLHQQLTTPVPRQRGELIGRHEEERIPKSCKDKIFPGSTPWGYVLPRVIIEQMGRGSDNVERTQKRILEALKIIDKVLKRSCETPIKLVVKLSEAVSGADADPKMVLYHLLSRGILEEQNCHSMFKEIIEEMKRSAPTLSRIYTQMSKEERGELGIVDFE